MAKPRAERPRVEGSGVEPRESDVLKLAPQVESIALPEPNTAAPGAVPPAEPQTAKPSATADISDERESAQGRTALEVLNYGPVEKTPPTQSSASGPRARSPQDATSETVFETIGLPPQPQMALPQQTQKRTAHLGYRVTEEFLNDVKKRTHLLVAVYGVPVDTVNLMILHEIAACFPAVERRIQEYLRGEGTDGESS